MVWSKLECQNQLFQGTVKVEKILEGSQDFIPSPSVKIQIMIYKGKKFAGCCQQASENRTFVDSSEFSCQKFESSLKVKLMVSNLCYLLNFFLTSYLR